jgi:hypothetical protein
MSEVLGKSKFGQQARQNSKEKPSFKSSRKAEANANGKLHFCDGKG